MNRKVFIVSDTHFFHKNIIKYHRGQYKDIDEMHDDMVAIWNNRVGENDLVIHLGDVALGGSRQMLWSLFRDLNGIKMLLPGNHDRGEIEDDRHYFNDIGFDNVEVGVTELVVGNYILTHEPMGIVPAGYTNIHGHCHGGITAAAHAVNDNKINVCWDVLEEHMLNVSNLLPFKTLAKEYDKVIKLQNKRVKHV